MGIKGLSILFETKSIRKRRIKIDNERYNGKILAVDASILLCASKALNVKYHEYILDIIMLMLKHNIFPIFVFDGPLTGVRDFAQYSKRDDNIRQMLTSIGIPHVTASREAEEMCCLLVESNLAFAVLSTDSDVLVFGCPILVHFDKYRTHFVETHIKTVLDTLELSQSEFIDLCILLGTDFNQRPRGFGPVNAYKAIKEKRKLENLGIKSEILEQLVYTRKWFVITEECKHTLNKIINIKTNNDDVSLLCEQYNQMTLHNHQNNRPACFNNMIDNLIKQGFTKCVSKNRYSSFERVYDNASLDFILYIYSIPQSDQTELIVLGGSKCIDREFSKALKRVSIARTIDDATIEKRVNINSVIYANMNMLLDFSIDKLNELATQAALVIVYNQTPYTTRNKNGLTYNMIGRFLCIHNRGSEPKETDLSS